MKRPLVSVVVPCHNSQDTLAKCLESLKKQSYKPIEIIVVDRNSKDKTRQIAKRFTSKIFIHGPERAAQMNLGIKKAKGKYIYRVDSDFIVQPNVIKQCVELCEKNNLEGIAVHNTSAEGLGFWADVRKFERNTYVDDDLIVAVRFFTKKSWEAVGGFDETLYGPEDYDFHNRFIAAGFRWGRIRAMEKHLGEPKSLSDIWEKHFYYGKQMVSYFKKHPRVATKQFNPLRISYLRHGSTLLAHPMIAVGLLIMTVVKFTAGGVGFLTAFLTGYQSEKRPRDAIKKLYRGLGWVSVFTSIRFWTGSFEELERWVPKKGKILDLGCGYGIFTNYLAYTSETRDIIGVDMDAHKVSFANRGLANTTFRVGDATKVVKQSCHGIVILDVMHHLGSYQDQEVLIGKCWSMLDPGGTLLILEVSNGLWGKLLLARIIDFFLYSGQPVYYRYKQSMVNLLQSQKKLKRLHIIDLSHNPFSHVAYVCTKK